VSHDLPLINMSSNGAPVRTRDRLVIRVDNLGAAFQFIAGGRLLQADGTQTDLQLSKNVAAVSLGNEFIFNLIDGWLLSFQANAQGTIIRQGDVWIEAFLAFGTGTNTQRYRSIFSGYLDQFSALSWPPVNRKVPREGPGRLIATTITAPAAGADWVTTSPAGFAEQIHSISGIFTTDANVATRRLSITVEDDTGGIVAVIPFITAQTASTTRRYTIAHGIERVEDNSQLISANPLPNIILVEDWLIRSAVFNIQAGDQWSQLTGASERWEDVPL